MSAQATEVVRPMAEAPIEDIVRFHGHMCPAWRWGSARPRSTVRIATLPGAFGTDPEQQELFAKVRQRTASETERARFGELHQARSQAILEAPEQDLYKVEELAGVEVPARARIHRSVTCAECGEPTMETRIRRLEGRELCPECFERALAA